MRHIGHHGRRSHKPSLHGNGWHEPHVSKKSIISGNNIVAPVPTFEQPKSIDGFNNVLCTGGVDMVSEAIDRPHKESQARDNNQREQRGDPSEGAVSHKRGYQQITGTWSDPDLTILDDRRGDLPEFPVEVLTPAWQEWLGRAAHGAGVTPGHVAVPLLGIASSIIGTSRRIKPASSWSEPLSMWTAIVGFSGTGKTPGIDVTKRALAVIERGRKEKIAGLRRAHEARAEAAKAAHKKWKAKVDEATEKGQAPPPMPAEAVAPAPFVQPRLYVSDVTIERLAVLLEARPSGMLLIADELAGLFLNMGRYSGGQDNEFWLEAWNGKPFVVERLSRPPVQVDHLLVGLTGGFQPDKLARSFDGDSDGMYARVLYGWPPEPSYQPLNNEVSEFDPDIVNALKRLVDLSETDDGTFAPRFISLSSDAVDEFEQFRQFLHGGKRGLDGREREWLAKGATHVLRLAGTLCYLSWAMMGGAEPTIVDVEFIRAAVRLFRDYFLPHSRAALRQVGLSERHANARRVLRWIRAQKMEEVSVKDVRRDALNQSLDAAQTLDCQIASKCDPFSRPKVTPA